MQRSLVLLIFVLGSGWPIGGETDAVSAFSLLSAEELKRIEPLVEERFFKSGAPHWYRRHRVVRIDTAALRNAFEQDAAQRVEGLQPAGVPIQLFDDLMVVVRVDQWITDDRGFAGAFGRLIPQDSITDDFEAYFSVEGQLEASFRTAEFAVGIYHIRDFQHYVILEIDRNDGAID